MPVETKQRDGLAVHQQAFSDVITQFKTDARLGLSEGEAQQRLALYGRNELASEKPTPAWRKFLAQFQEVLVVVLLIATAVSALLWVYQRESEWPYEAITIFAVVLLNAAMGYIQEERAKSAVAALRQMAATLPFFQYRVNAVSGG